MDNHKPKLGETVLIPGDRQGVVWSAGREDNGSGGVSLGWLIIPEGETRAIFVRFDQVRKIPPRKPTGIF